MPTWKATMFLQHASNVSSPNAAAHRTGGWSESWYSGAASLQALLANLGIGAAPPTQIGGAVLPTIGLLPARAALLPLGSTIVGARVQQIVPLAGAQSLSALFPGNPNWEADVPQMALLCRMPGLNVANIRRFTLRALPDQFVTEGEFTFGTIFATAVQNFFQSLANFQFRGRDLSQPTVKIVNITSGATFIVTCETAFAPTVNSFVRILKTRDSTGNLRGGRFQVLTVGPGNNVFTIGLWPFGNTTGGSARVDGIVFPTCDAQNAATGRVVTRRVGRPFVQYRGRRARKR